MQQLLTALRSHLQVDQLQLLQVKRYWFLEKWHQCY